MAKSQNSLETLSDKIIIGRVDVLFRFLQLINKDSPQDLDKYLEGLDESKPIADQVIIKIIAENIQLYEEYAKALAEAGVTNIYASSEEVVEILQTWLALKSLIDEIIKYTQGSQGHDLSDEDKLEPIKWLELIKWLSNEDKKRISERLNLAEQLVYYLLLPQEMSEHEHKQTLQKLMHDFQSVIAELAENSSLSIGLKNLAQKQQEAAKH